MTTTTAGPVTVTGFEAEYAALGRYLDEHPEIADLLSHVHSLPVRGHTPAERHAELERIAGLLGAEVRPGAPGFSSACVRFGRVVVEVHTSATGFSPPLSVPSANLQAVAA
jgi:hypothetical protein